MKKATEEINVHRFGCIPKGKSVNEMYEIDYTRKLPNSRGCCELLKAKYRADNSYRVIERIPRNRINIPAFAESMMSIFTVRSFTNNRTIPTSSAPMSGTKTAISSTLCTNLRRHDWST